MNLWGSKTEEPEQTPGPIDGEVLDAGAGLGPFGGMIMKMIANNPALANAFTSLETMARGYHERMERMEQKQDEILTLLRGSKVSAPNLTGSGIIADGIHCALCGSAGECLEACPNNPNFKPLQTEPEAAQ